MIDGVDVSGCNFRLERDNQQKCECTHATGFGVICDCDKWQNCYFKQLARKTQECERMKYYLNKIRDEELQSLDIEWDEYITECDTTDYSNIITYVEYALGEKEDD